MATPVLAGLIESKARGWGLCMHGQSFGDPLKNRYLENVNVRKYGIKSYILLKNEQNGKVWVGYVDREAT